MTQKNNGLENLLKGIDSIQNFCKSLGITYVPKIKIERRVQAAAEYLIQYYQSPPFEVTYEISKIKGPNFEFDFNEEGIPFIISDKSLVDKSLKLIDKKASLSDIFQRAHNYKNKINYLNYSINQDNEMITYYNKQVPSLLSRIFPKFKDQNSNRITDYRLQIKRDKEKIKSTDKIIMPGDYVNYALEIIAKKQDLSHRSFLGEEKSIGYLSGEMSLTWKDLTMLFEKTEPEGIIRELDMCD